MLYPGTAITALITYHSRLREQSFALDDFACEHNALPMSPSRGAGMGAGAGATSPRRAAERLHHEMLDEFGAMAEDSSGSESEVSSDEDDEVDMFEQMRQTVEVRVKRAVLADWVTFIRRIKHHQMKAALCLQRCARLGELAGGGEQMWVGERVMLVFEVWRRYTIFRRSIRNQTGIPVFPKRLRQWNNFVDLYQARKMRERKAMLVRRCAGFGRAYRLFVRVWCGTDSCAYPCP